MSTFDYLVSQTQKEVEASLKETGFNPISVISVQAFEAVNDLSLAEIAAVIAERPQILEHEVRLSDPAPRSVGALDVVHEAIRMEVEMSIDVDPFAAQLADWLESTRVPAHLTDSVTSALRTLRQSATR